MQKWELQLGIKRKLVLCIGGLSLVAISSLLIYIKMVEADAVAFNSCLLSIHENVKNAEDAGKISLPIIEEWTYLSPEHIDKLAETTVFENCRQMNSNVLIDVWGEKIQIAYHYQTRFHSFPPSFRVWSKGPDRVAGTADDTLQPPGPVDTLYNLADRWP